jgi:hypothetical protein
MVHKWCILRTHSVLGFRAMPWTAKDATRHTKKARTPHEKAVWARISTNALHSGKSEASSIRIANAVIKRGIKK